MNKRLARLRRARKTRAKIAQLKKIRLVVYRSNAHMYAQITTSDGSKVLAAASTLSKELRDQVKNGGNVAAAALVGKAIAEKAKALGIESVAFDRSGYLYHGRVKALAEAAREAGLKF
ncbi:50S ribosomal protein L18 [Hydrogenophilus thiooxidans]|uniref:Large ribosomal subunit protein uL18 n=1 Tax=uncultured beta proteobacterium TaxID=86027 RepID=H5SGY4_9PROT|nr:50S ribosomal protein L18 [Hydrogenophilus thiooxidans]BAL55420.1 50S ribosomal protein L18 [uncultured beta proteobacterium]